ncbi:methyltransferase [Sulfuracidifex metallicus DSM 6482 = JCM 9184]|uniref:Methyltransferase n=2 Tax=Sulfuracidifex metallicus TaxID=47303 RepID=A0A6A9QGE1_SULME|nr:methyltransferase [Sulfuracidifex metallicus]MUN28277.1 methyltransferase [Sulfuracidifex metallicus DSM 6482 = JCM 9184]WOE51192.1 methyltransferase [Sulfuracidifex metallicus DSM 6482 = JCM 9184]
MIKTEVVLDVIDGIPLSFYSSTGIFSKRKVDVGTRALLENLVIPERGIVADVGCGYGPVGIFLALKNPSLKVIMLDIDPNAVKLSKKNVEINGVSSRVTVMKSDVLSAVNEKLDAIFSNPPLSKGVDFLKKFAKCANDKIKEDGFLEIVVYRGEENVKKEFSPYFPSINVIKRVKGYSIILIKKK